MQLDSVGSSHHIVDSDYPEEKRNGSGSKSANLWCIPSPRRRSVLSKLGLSLCGVMVILWIIQSRRSPYRRIGKLPKSYSGLIVDRSRY